MHLDCGTLPLLWVNSLLGLALAQSLTPIIATVPTTAAAAVHKIAIVGCAIAAIDATTKVTYTASACGSITLCAQA